MRQTDLRQTGVALVKLHNEQVKDVPLFSTDILSESYELLHKGIVKEVISVTPFVVIRNGKTSVEERRTGVHQEDMDNIFS